MNESANNIIINDPKLSHDITALNAAKSSEKISLIPVFSVIGLVTVLTITLPLIIRFCTNNN